MALTIVLVAIDQMFIAGMTGRPHRESLTVNVVFFSSWALPAITITGGGLGIAALLYKGRGKRIVWLSIAGNAVVLFLFCACLVLAILFEGYGSTP